MKQIVLFDREHEILEACVEFCIDELSDTEGTIGKDVNLVDVRNLRRVIEICTREVEP